jgi:signal transduction histidine kinase
MQERARKLRGGLRITSQSPHGTTVELWVPARLAYTTRTDR